MIGAVVVALAALGTLVRWQLGRLNGVVPFGTLAVNIGAAFGAGLLVGSSDTTLTVAGVGLLGSVSTFSTLVGEITDSQRPSGVRVAYLMATLVVGVAAAAVGVELRSG